MNKDEEYKESIIDRLGKVSIDKNLSLIDLLKHRYQEVKKRIKETSKYTLSNYINALKLCKIKTSTSKKILYAYMLYFLFTSTTYTILYFFI